MQDLLDKYAGLVHKDIPVTSDWDDELNEISYIRELLHRDIEHVDKIRLKKIDNLWKSQINKSAGEWEDEFSYPRDGLSKYHWWAWIDKFSELSDEEKRNL